MQELVHGCLRLRGTAKQIDLHCFGFTLTKEILKMQSSVKYIENVLQMRGDGI